MGTALAGAFNVKAAPDVSGCTRPYCTSMVMGSFGLIWRSKGISRRAVAWSCDTANRVACPRPSILETVHTRVSSGMARDRNCPVVFLILYLTLVTDSMR